MCAQLLFFAVERLLSLGQRRAGRFVGCVVRDLMILVAVEHDFAARAAEEVCGLVAAVAAAGAQWLRFGRCWRCPCQARGDFADLVYRLDHDGGVMTAKKITLEEGKVSVVEWWWMRSVKE